LTCPRQRHKHGGLVRPVLADFGELMIDILAIGICLLVALRLLGLPGELTEGAPLVVRTE